MTNHMPAWAQLLQNYEQAPTLPFIIGALREHARILDAQGDAFTQVLELLQAMASHRVSQEKRLTVFVYLCGQIVVPVFSIKPEAEKLYYPSAFPTRADGETCLCFSVELARNKDCELDEIADTLFYSYEHATALELRHYSRDSDRKIWRPFDDSDRTKLIEAFEKRSNR